MPKVFSFDIFDTCITRMHAYPRDLFYDLGLRLAPASANGSARQRFAQRFQRARICAEKIANWRARHHGRAHADIHSIYQNLRWLIRLDRTLDELVSIELALEDESLYPIGETMALIESLRTAGHRIVFISDMYIPGRLLRPLLMRKGVIQEGDDLYVSCDVGCAKYDGRLFEYVLEHERLSGADLLHTGDNQQADIAKATMHGIRTQHFTAAHLTEREARFAGSKLPRESACTWLTGFSRRCRLAMRHKSAHVEHPLDSIIFGVVMPFLLAHVQWVLDDARQRGIRRLYFIARDGEVLLKIARQLNPEGIELRYLYGSRRAWLAPSIEHDQPEWKRLLAVAGNANAPRDIAERVGLDDSAQSRLRSVLGMDDLEWERSLSLDKVNTFIDRLVEYSASAELLRLSTSDKRLLALRYFKQEGLMDRPTWALVDSGWSLNSQAALKRILDHAGKVHQTPQGYYIGLAHDRLQEAQAGKAFSFVNPPGSLFSRRRVVIEHCFLPATHASTRGYRVKDGQAIPDFSEETRGHIEIAYAQRLHAVATEAANLIALDADLRMFLKRFAPEARDAAASFLCNPDRADALAMGQLTAIADMRQEQHFAKPLCGPLQLKDVWTTMSMAVSRSKKFKSPAWMWLEGSAALSPHFVRLPIRSMLWLDSLKHRLSLRS